MLKKKIIVFLLPIKVRKFDLIRYDVLEFEKKLGFKVEIHEIIKFIHPGFDKAFQNTIKDKRILSFKKFSKWQTYIEKLIKNYKQILVIKNIHNTNFQSIRLNNYLFSKKELKIIEFSTIQSPYLKIKLSIFKKLSIFFDTFFKNPRKIIVFIKQVFFINLSKIFNVNSNYIISTGRKLNKISAKQMKIIKGNSFDYNMYLKSKNIKLTKPYGLFLEAPSPLFPGDSYLDGVRLTDLGTPNKWFESLDKFFNLIEKYKNLQIKIVAHPKVKHKNKFPKYYYGREVLSHRLSEVAKYSKVFITRDSTGSSFAAIHKKPLIFIHTKEFLEKKNNFIINQKYLASCFGLKPINIDEMLNYKIISFLFKYDKKKYEKYVYNYLTSRKDKKLNYKLIEKIF